MDNAIIFAINFYFRILDSITDSNFAYNIRECFFAKRKEVLSNMSLDILSQSANSRIKVNSFYDVFKEYSDEELKRYKRFSGISAESKYQEILDELEKEDAE